MKPQQHISTPAMHLDPPATRFHPPPTCFHPQTQVSTTYDPPAVHFDPDWHPRHMFRPPMTPQPAFQPRLAPQAPKRMYNCSYVCFSFCFFLFGFKNTCTSNHTRVSCVYYLFLPSNACMIACTCVSYVFIHLLYIFTPKTHVWAITHMFPCKYMYASSSI